MARTMNRCLTIQHQEVTLVPKSYPSVLHLKEQADIKEEVIEDYEQI